MLDIGKVKCPICGSKNKKNEACWTTFMGYLKEYDENGKCINEGRDPNIKTHELSCLKCGAKYKVKEQYGELYKGLL